MVCTSITRCAVPLLLLALGGWAWSARGDTQLSAGHYDLPIPTHITGTGQACSASVGLTLSHDTACTVVLTASLAGSEVLQNGSDSLATSYKLTGVALANPDADWVSAGDFVGHLYSLPGSGANDQLTLWAKGTAPAHTAMPAGAYSASLTVTVTW